MGGCQNYGPFLGTPNIRCRIIMGIQKGTIILTTTHIWFRNLKDPNIIRRTSSRVKGSGVRGILSRVLLERFMSGFEYITRISIWSAKRPAIRFAHSLICFHRESCIRCTACDRQTAKQNKESTQEYRVFSKLWTPFGHELCYGTCYLGVPKSDANFGNCPCASPPWRL